MGNKHASEERILYGDSQIRVKNTLRQIEKEERETSVAANYCVHIVLENKSRYPLQYRCSGTSSGYFFSKVINAFRGPSQTIQPGYVGGIIVSTINKSNCFGCVGYICFKIQAAGRSYLITFGFSADMWWKNQAGLEVRQNDGAQDQYGRIIGHTVDPDPIPSNIKKFCNLEANQSSREVFEEYNLDTSCFKLKLQWDSWNSYYLTVENMENVAN